MMKPRHYLIGFFIVVFVGINVGLFIYNFFLQKETVQLSKIPNIPDIPSQQSPPMQPSPKAPQPSQAIQPPVSSPQIPHTQSALSPEEAIIIFKSGKEIATDQKSKIVKLINLMQNNSNIKIKISGHSDNIGKFNTKIDISRGRAEVVKKFLTNSGIESNRIQIEVYADTKPIADNNTEVGRAKNRRVEIEVMSN
ncbi:MAG: OmpA family protein [Candidatus Competibacteraceae bacterium]